MLAEEAEQTRRGKSANLRSVELAVPEGHQAVNRGIMRVIGNRKILENPTFSYRALPAPDFQFTPESVEELFPADMMTHWRCQKVVSRGPMPSTPKPFQKNAPGRSLNGIG